ncbi:MAG: pyridoxamine 5'-phosphate oxidase family protein [Acidimicrobiia bacterium]|nr:pyridoxamine 5'-phosphate oxidase family protein [Acidimicrobiia bacterium]
MSRRDLIRMTEAEIEEFLGGRHTMNIATFGPDGNIHLVAMWYGFLDGQPAFETFAKSQKVKNLRRNPEITVLVEDGETYDELRGVEMVGRAEIFDDPEHRSMAVAGAGRGAVLGRRRLALRGGSRRDGRGVVARSGCAVADRARQGGLVGPPQARGRLLTGAGRSRTTSPTTDQAGRRQGR